ncbi:hypothetical protein LINPERPRIM_LOCUS13159 [Linum perenne]
MRRTLKNKAAELSTLCGIDVAYVCFEPNYKVDLWSRTLRIPPLLLLQLIPTYSRTTSTAKYKFSERRDIGSR